MKSAAMDSSETATQTGSNLSLNLTLWLLKLIFHGFIFKYTLLMGITYTLYIINNKLNTEKQFDPDTSWDVTLWLVLTVSSCWLVLSIMDQSSYCDIFRLLVNTDQYISAFPTVGWNQHHIWYELLCKQSVTQHVIQISALMQTAGLSVNWCHVLIGSQFHRH